MPLLHQKGYNDVIHSKALECSLCETDQKWLIWYAAWEF